MVEEQPPEQKQTVEISLEGAPLKIKVGDKIQCTWKGDKGHHVLQELCGAVFQVNEADDDYVIVEITEKTGSGPGAQIGDIKTIERKYITDAYFEKK